jgi:hypothetical protein
LGTKRNNLTFERKIRPIDLNHAEEAIIRAAQLKAYPREYGALKHGQSVALYSVLRKLCPIMVDGTIRVGGRLGMAVMSISERHPAILPKKPHVTELIVRHQHAVLGHAGPEHTLAFIRTKYWIPDWKSVVKTILRSCIVCKKLNSTAMNQVMTPLPKERTDSDSPPFTVTGLDAFGPMIVKRGRIQLKRWGLILTCFAFQRGNLSMKFDSGIGDIRLYRDVY